MMNVTVNFNEKNGRIRKELYGSGLHIFTYPRAIDDFTEIFKTLRFPIVRNHDWALNNPGQLMIDVQNVFPLLHLDASDERNYIFAPSDEVIRLVYEAGSKVFYRLGTSIEHTKDWHYNALPPADFNQFAEACAGIIRHYTKGWANGFHYDMTYWEIWNEPDGHKNMWTGSDELFAEFFALVLKRLKSEFPELKIGGPAHCSFKPELISMLKAECDKLGVKPDFYSYHIYANNFQKSEYVATEPRKYLDSIGWNDVETCLNEWHFIRAWKGVHSNITEESYRRTNESADGLHGINSAAFNIGTFAIWQNSPIDSAYYYGCGNSNFGIRKPSRCFNKNYYSLLIMRDLVYDYPVKVTIDGGSDTIRSIAGLSEDGTQAAVVIADLCGPEMEIPLEIKGFENPSKVTCILLDDLRNNEEITCEQDENGIYKLPKSAPGSAVFMLRLEK